MSIASELEKLNTNLANSYTAVNTKGGTIPSEQNFDNLPSAINSIYTGGDTYTVQLMLEDIINKGNAEQEATVVSQTETILEDILGE